MWNYNILKDEELKIVGEVLESKRHELRKQSRGKKPNEARAFINEYTDSIDKIN